MIRLKYLRDVVCDCIGALARVLGCSFYVDDVEEKVLHPLQLPQDEDQQAIAVYLRLRHSGSRVAGWVAGCWGTVACLVTGWLGDWLSCVTLH